MEKVQLTQELIKLLLEATAEKLIGHNNFQLYLVVNDNQTLDNNQDPNF